MKTAPSFQFYPSDFLGGTVHMSAAEVGAYIRLLCHQWHQGGIPAEVAKIERIAGLKRAKLAEVMAKFEPAGNGLLCNARMELVRQGLETYRQQQLIRGLKGGRPPRSKTSVKTAAAPGDLEFPDNPPVISGLPNQEPERNQAVPSGLPKVEPDDNQTVSSGLSKQELKITSQSHTHSQSLSQTSPPPQSPPREQGRGEVEGFVEGKGKPSVPWPRLEEVLAYAPQVMATPECAEHFWNKYEQVGWVFQGQEIRDWQPGFRNFATTWKANHSQRQQSAPRLANARIVNGQALSDGF